MNSKQVINSFRGEYRFLSNFWEAKVWYEGIKYPSVEHAYQAQKTEIKDIKLTISKMENAGQVKKYGSKLFKDMLSEEKDRWNKNKIPVMAVLVEKKFRFNKDLKKELLATYPRELIEGNNWGDMFWGMTKKIGEEAVGENHLGKILMNVRRTLLIEKEIKRINKYNDHSVIREIFKGIYPYIFDPCSQCGFDPCN